MFRPAQAETSDPYFEYGSESPDDEESATRRRVAWLAAKRRATQPRSPGLNRRGRPSCNAIAIDGSALEEDDVGGFEGLGAAGASDRRALRGADARGEGGEAVSLRR